MEKVSVLFEPEYEEPSEELMDYIRSLCEFQAEYERAKDLVEAVIDQAYEIGLKEGMRK